MGADENLDLTPDMPLIQLKQILETHFDWAIDADYDVEDARYLVLVPVSGEGRAAIGVRGEEIGEEKGARAGDRAHRAAGISRSR